MSDSIDPAILEKGKEIYHYCIACHGSEGKGAAFLAPPLAKSEWVTGDPDTLIKIQLRGLEGKISVAGKEYNFPAPMMPNAHLDDESLAAVLTYIRNTFGNEASAITPDQVAALRSEVGKPMLQGPALVAELKASTEKKSENSASHSNEDHSHDESSSTQVSEQPLSDYYSKSSPPYFVIGGILLLLTVFIVIRASRKTKK